MIKIIKWFIIIRLRKFLGKGDFLSYGISLLAIIFIDYVLIDYVEEYAFFFLFFSLKIYKYHFQRKDLELLKFCKNYKAILFLEYTIYSLPITILFLISFQWLYLVIYQLLLVGYLALPTFKTFIIKYPFKLFDPQWVISYRKYKLALFFPIILFFIFIGSQYKNEGLITFGILIGTTITCIPSFKRESLYHIKVSEYSALEYHMHQMKTAIHNSLYVVIPIAIIVMWLNYSMLIVIFLIVLLMLLNIFLKYTFFNSILQQQFFFVFIIGGFQYFLPIIAFPILFYWSQKKLMNDIEN